MKTLIIYSFLSLFILTTQAQNCDNYEDCFAKGKAEQNSNNAIDYFSKAVKYANKEKINPSDVYFWRGIKYYTLSKGPDSKKENENAEADFLEAAKNDPSNYNIINYLAAFYQLKEKDYPKGIAFMDNQISKDPNNASAYYDRGNIHRYYSKNDLALADFKKAFEIMEAGTQSIEIYNSAKGHIPVFYALLKLKNENTNIHTTQSTAILEKANQLVPNNDVILSELSLAYLDTGISEKALKTANEALQLQNYKGYTDSYNTKIPGAQTVLAFNAYNSGNYEEAAYRSGTAANESQRIFRHPAIVFYAAIIKYDRYARLYPDKWKAQEAKIIKDLEEAITLADGTQYQNMADDAKKYVNGIKFPYGKQEDDGNLANEYQEFLLNFEKLSSSYVMTLGNLKGRDITNIPFTKKWIPIEGELNAIGKITECNGNKIMIVLIRDGGRNDFRFIKIGPKGEYMGWQGITNVQLYGGKSQHSIATSFSINNNIIKTKTKNTNYETGKSWNDDRVINCNETWKF